jgi:hypothetical protein
MKQILFLSLVLFSTSSAQALIEVRGSLGFGIIDSHHFNSILQSNAIPEVHAVGEYGVDAILHVPATSFVVGVRYDWQGIKVGDDNSNHAGVACSRIAALLGYRIVNVGGLFVGPIFSYGIKHTPEISVKIGSSDTTYDEGDSESISGGIEAGGVFGPLLLAAEGGFQSYLIKDVRKGQNHAGFDLNLGAFYGRAMIGVSF